MLTAMREHIKLHSRVTVAELQIPIHVRPCKTSTAVATDAAQVGWHDITFPLSAVQPHAVIKVSSDEDVRFLKGGEGESECFEEGEGV